MLLDVADLLWCSPAYSVQADITAHPSFISFDFTPALPWVFVPCNPHPLSGTPTIQKRIGLQSRHQACQ